MMFCLLRTNSLELRDETNCDYVVMLCFVLEFNNSRKTLFSHSFRSFRVEIGRTNDFAELGTRATRLMIIQSHRKRSAIAIRQAITFTASFPLMLQVLLLMRALALQPRVCRSLSLVLRTERATHCSLLLLLELLVFAQGQEQEALDSHWPQA